MILTGNPVVVWRQCFSGGDNQLMKCLCIVSQLKRNCKGSWFWMWWC